MTAHKGFTLLELMTTILVGSVLLAIAVPSFRQMSASNRLTTQANDVVAALNLSRSEAIKRNTSITFCRAAAATDTTCVTSTGNWQNWIVRTGGGTVIRRGSVGTYNGTLVLKSTLTNDQVTFGSEGLARTGGTLVDSQTITVCVSNISANNKRVVTLGAGSRIFTAPAAGGC
jgi:type IV fimbrial biogenesis protein FimT